MSDLPASRGALAGEIERNLWRHIDDHAAQLDEIRAWRQQVDQRFDEADGQRTRQSAMVRETAATLARVEKLVRKLLAAVHRMLAVGLLLVGGALIVTLAAVVVVLSPDQAKAMIVQFAVGLPVGGLLQGGALYLAAAIGAGVTLWKAWRWLEPRVIRPLWLRIWRVPAPPKVDQEKDEA